MIIPWGPTLRVVMRRRGTYAAHVLAIAVAFAVVVHAIVVASWFQGGAAVDTGMPLDRLLAVRAERRATTSLDEDERALAALPGVAVAAWVDRIPLSFYHTPDVVTAAGHEELAWILVAEPQIGQALEVELLAGRYLVAGDATAPSPMPVLVTRSLAESLGLTPRQAVGARFEVATRRREASIAGVVADFVVHSGFMPRPTSAVLWPSPARDAALRQFVVRLTDGQVSGRIPAIVSASLARGAPTRFVDATPLGVASRADLRFAGGAQIILLVVVGIVLLTVLLSSVAVASFMVVERTRQIGVHRAIGARRRDVVVQVLVESTVVSGFGVLFGLPIAYLLNLAMRGVQPHLALGGRAVVACAALLLVTGWLAVLLPALRAARVPPVVASRTV